MYMRNTCTCLYKSSIRSISTAINNYAKSHYEALGINSTATQAEIKSAYYKLSKVYHPDKNQGSEEAATKFRDITAAYEILGNVRTRKLYDKGVHFDEPAYKHPAEDDDPKTRFYRSREHKHRPTGRTPIYDFDEWSRAHYGATFARDMERKRREQMLREMAIKNENDIRAEKVVFAFMFFVIVLMYMTREDHDVDKRKTFYDTAKTPKTS